jgi:hypothetical protein
MDGSGEYILIVHECLANGDVKHPNGRSMQYPIPQS